MREMAKVIDKAIGDCQDTFVGGWQILNTTLIANKVIDDELIYRRREGVLCKLDIEKTMIM